jgi:hypothetical protein
MANTKSSYVNLKLSRTSVKWMIELLGKTPKTEKRNVLIGKLKDAENAAAEAALHGPVK